jgi:hypothetical protein
MSGTIPERRPLTNGRCPLPAWIVASTPETSVVIPAQAGIALESAMDTRFRGYDVVACCRPRIRHRHPAHRPSFPHKRKRITAAKLVNS